jgi:uncharacterized protein YycO
MASMTPSFKTCQFINKPQKCSTILQGSTRSCSAHHLSLRAFRIPMPESMAGIKRHTLSFRAAVDEKANEALGAILNKEVKNHVDKDRNHQLFQLRSRSELLCIVLPESGKGLQWVFREISGHGGRRGCRVAELFGVSHDDGP